MASASLPDSSFAVIVLCGGSSERMGRPKALLPFGDEALLVRVLRLASGVCGERIVVAAEGQDLPELPAGVRVVRDAVSGEGPLAGLAAGLAACSSAAAFCTPCDTPFLRPEFAAHLLAARGDAEGVRPVLDGRVQPLPAVYATILAERAGELIGAGRRRVLFLGEGRSVLDLPEIDWRRADPRATSFRNCNTPEEYAAALREAGH